MHLSDPRDLLSGRGDRWPSGQLRACKRRSYCTVKSYMCSPASAPITAWILGTSVLGHGSQLSMVKRRDGMDDARGHLASAVGDTMLY